VSQQPAFPVFCFEGPKSSVSRIQFSARYKTELENISLSLAYYQRGRLGSDSFDVFGFSFDVLTQDCKSKFSDPLWC